MFEYFTEDDLISPEVRVVFLYISKSFDKVWHNGLIYKVKENGKKGDLLDTLTNFLDERKQRVILNDQHSTWTNVEARAPQSSILGPLLFLIYINDLPENLVWNPKLLPDGTSLFSVIRNKQSSVQNLNKGLSKINHWAFEWKMSFNLDPGKQAQEVIFFRKFQKSVYPLSHFNNIAVAQPKPRSI